MLLDQYQNEAIKFGIYPRVYAVEYPLIGLANEAGEALGKMKKVLRGDRTLGAATDDIADELGDVLWYLSVAASDLGIPLSEIAERNIAKLKGRSTRGTLMGDGDHR